MMLLPYMSLQKPPLLERHTHEYKAPECHNMQEPFYNMTTFALTHIHLIRSNPHILLHTPTLTLTFTHTYPVLLSTPHLNPHPDPRLPLSVVVGEGLVGPHGSGKRAAQNAAEE